MPDMNPPLALERRAHGLTRFRILDKEPDLFLELSILFGIFLPDLLTVRFQIRMDDNPVAHASIS